MSARSKKPLLVGLALLPLGACRGAPAPSGDAGAAPSASAPTGQPGLDGAAALARVRELPEVAERLKQDPQARIALDPKSPELVVSVGRGPADVGEMVFVLDAKTGAISVDMDRHEHFTRGHPISLADWRDERVERPKVAARVTALPEVAGFEKGLVAAGLGLSLWLERAPPRKDCDPKTDCDWAFYVGEAHPDHSVRRVSVLVDRGSGEISVVGFDAKRVPYATWRKSRTAASMRAGK